jgi:hypothetical protein
MVEGNFCAVVLCETEAGRYRPSAAQAAVTVHFPVPVVIATIVPLIKHPFAVITAVVLAFVLANTVKVD